MAVEVSSWVWNNSQSRKGQRLVLLAIADCARSDGANAFPSIAELARKTALSERAVQRAIRDLAELGELAVHRGTGPNGVNRYRVVMTPVKTTPPSKRHPDESTPPTEEASTQVNGEDPGKSAPPGNLPPPSFSTDPPGNLPPGTVRGTVTSSSTKKKGGVRGGKNTDEDPLFVEFYDAYPRKKDRGAARKAWAEVTRKGFDPNVIIEAARRYQNDPQVKRGYGKYPATWLRAESFLDEPEQLAATGNPSHYTDEEYRSGF